jgi:4-coumarate--CoA ligase
MMLGYIDNPRATKDVFDENGWLRTGDVGHVHNGKIFVVDRKKDLIKVRGWQVSPAEVEGKIMQHPFILDAAVIGIELANKTGELGRAYIVAKPGTQVTEADIRTFISKDLANYKIPDEYVFTDHIPKNPTGKILRRQLREQAARSGKPVPTKESVMEGTAGGPWRYAKRLSQTASLASRSLYQLFSWLKGFFYCN